MFKKVLTGFATISSHMKCVLPALQTFSPISGLLQNSQASSVKIALTPKKRSIFIISFDIATMLIRLRIKFNWKLSQQLQQQHWKERNAKYVMYN